MEMNSEIRGLDGEKNESLIADVNASLALGEDAYDQSALDGDTYRLLFEANPQPMWVYDVETYKFLTVNNAAVNHYGYSRQEFLQMTIKDIRPAMEVPGLSHIINNDLGSLTEAGVWTHVAKGGRLIEAEITSQSIEFNGKPARLVLATDVTERRQAEKATQVSETRYRLLFESIPIPVFIYEQESLAIVDVNQAAAGLYGYGRQEFLSMTVMDLRPAEEIPHLMESMPEYTAAPQRFGVWKHRKKDGTVFYVEVTSFSLMLFGKQVRVSVCNDVTASKRNEIEWEVIAEIIQGVNLTANLDELLQLIHRSLQKAVYAENFFVTLYDEPTDLFWFPFYVDKYDSAPEPIKMTKTCTAYVFRTGKSILMTEQLYQDLIDQEEIELVGTHSHSWLGVPLRTPTKTIGVLVLQHYEDENAFTKRDLQFLENVAGQIALAIDRKRADEALMVMNLTLNEVIQSAPLAITAFSPEGKVRMWNSAAERMFGWTAEEVKSIEFPILPDLSPEELDKYRRDILDGQRISNHETQRPTKDGTLVDVSVSVGPLCNAVGDPTAILAMMANISERKHAEAMLRQTEEQLRQSQKMEAIGQLAGGVAHDFNNLLTAILGYTELLLGRPDNEEFMTTSLEEIRKAGHRAAALTSQLLAFSRKQVLLPKVLDLNSIVSDMDKMLRRLIGEDVTLRTLLQRGLGRVKVDPGQIEQVIMNLAVNARDAMPNGGDLLIETSDVFLDEGYARQHTGVAAGRYILMAVTDTGYGMDAETQSRIFEPFYTTKEVGKGTGLGLSTVYGIINQSGGHIWVFSEVGIGTTFKIYLPRFEDETSIAVSSQVAKSAYEGTETVLIVEDEEVVRTMVVKLLSEMGYRILPASRGDEALRISREHTGPINLLLTDVVMPQMSGNDLAESIKETRPDMKVLFMTGYTATGQNNLSSTDVQRPYLQKPFSLGSLASSVRKVLDETTKS